jgi:hypothetical protein
MEFFCIHSIINIILYFFSQWIFCIGNAFYNISAQKLELVLSWATLHFAGWVEPTPGFVGFLRRRTNLHFAGVIANCETQQQPISEPSSKSFFFDLAVFWPAAPLV